MPQWNWHLAVAQDVMERVKVGNDHSFLIGSLLPDMPWMNKEERNDPTHRVMSHEACNYESVCLLANVEEWLSRNHECVTKCDMYKGALTHIVLDHAVNMLWSQLVTKVHVNEIYFPLSGKERTFFTLDEVAQYKWTDTATYAAQFTDRALQAIKCCPAYSEEIAYVLFQHYGISDVNNLRWLYDNITNEIKSQKTAERTLVPVQAYRDIHNEVVMQCSRMLSAMSYGNLSGGSPGRLY